MNEREKDWERNEDLLWFHYTIVAFFACHHKAYSALRTISILLKMYHGVCTDTGQHLVTSK